MNLSKFVIGNVLLLMIVPLLSFTDAFSQGKFAGLDHPISVYINWSAYDEASDTIKLTEELSMKELEEVIRLKKNGVRIDYYMMDDFWYDPTEGYREWRKEDWQEGAWKKWIERCCENDIKPGLWVSTNDIRKFVPVDEWKNSLDVETNTTCMFVGGFLNHFMQSLQLWYDEGIRMFKFDFAWFMAATPEGKEIFTPREVYELNFNSFSAAMRLFKAKNPEVVFVAYNGFLDWLTFKGFDKFMDSRWLDFFDSMYCGDPRASDIPCMSFWRSMDMFSDQQVRIYENNGMPLPKIDNAAFIIGTTGAAYNRGAAAWKGMLLLSFARGGWFNSYYGNLELLDDSDAKWFAKVQKMFLELQEFGQISTFGDMPVNGSPYGYRAIAKDGALYTIVNPSQSIQKVKIETKYDTKGAILFTDAGFKPQLKEKELTLGPEQVVLVGFGEYSDVKKYDLGKEEEVVIPAKIEKIPTVFKKVGENKFQAVIENFNSNSTLRIVCSQKGDDGKYHRVSGGDNKGFSVGEIIKLRVTQHGKELPIEINWDKKLWSGISWATGEIEGKNIDRNKPLIITYELKDPKQIVLEGNLYKVDY